jgi:non-ribosomal peptide synthetase component F
VNSGLFILGTWFHSFQALTKQLRSLAKNEGSTLYTLLLSTFYTLLFRYTGQDDLIIGSPMAGRSSLAREEVVIASLSRILFHPYCIHHFAIFSIQEQCVGYFVNPVALRTNVGGNPTFRSLMQRVRNTVMQALVHQDMPFPLLVEKIQSTRDPSRSPIFQVLCICSSFFF